MYARRSLRIIMSVITYEQADAFSKRSMFQLYLQVHYHINNVPQTVKYSRKQRVKEFTRELSEENG